MPTAFGTRAGRVVEQRRARHQIHRRAPILEKREAQQILDENVLRRVVLSSVCRAVPRVLPALCDG